MRTTQYLLYTLKETPHDASIISHQLMLRSGMIRQLSTGLYIWLPTGIRVLNKIQIIIRKEMEAIHAYEISMPILQPEYLWQESGRLEIYGKELLILSDRKKNNFILSPTNEEMITHFIRSEINSYKKLPIIVYQIQEKFRDEIRPRFGVIRAREFIMKDAYSFHSEKKCLEKTYKIIQKSYCNIFKKIKINFYIVKANSGSMGGDISHEFQALSPNGENKIVFSNNSLYASNIDVVKSIEAKKFFQENKKLNEINNNIVSKKILKNKHDINIPITHQIKTILIKTKDNNIAALLIRADHEINIEKIENIDIILKPLTLLNENKILKKIGVKKNYLGPIGLSIPIIADISVIKMKNFSVGANIDNHYFTNVNWNVDLPIPIVKDIRQITEKDINPDGTGSLKIRKSIEIGHIFQLGKKYSNEMNAFIQTKNGNKKNIYMGCYGIGLTRIIAAVIEQNHDKNGIIWPVEIAPFEVAILPINIKYDTEIKKVSETLYANLRKNNIDVLLDDRQERTGIMFSEIDLIGIPHQIIISQNSIKNGNVEYRQRKNKKSILITQHEIISFINKILKK